MSTHRLNLLDFSNKSVATLHFTWFAFFLTFVMWFSLPSLKPLITASIVMTPQQWAELLASGGVLSEAQATGRLSQQGLLQLEFILPTTATGTNDTLPSTRTVLNQ